MPTSKPTEHPGAGTYWVYGVEPPTRDSRGSSSRSGSATRRKRGPSATGGRRSISLSRSRERRRRQRRGPRAGSSDEDDTGAGLDGGDEGGSEWPPRWSAVREGKDPQWGIVQDISPDALLSRGIAEYTFMSAEEGGVLGRGKFSTVYKVKGTDGQVVSLLEMRRGLRRAGD